MMMHSFKARALLLYITLIVAVSGQKSLRPPQNTCTAGDAFEGAKCIRRQERNAKSPGFVTGFCSSVLQITTPTLTQIATSTSTVIVPVTSTTGTDTITEPATTQTITETNTSNSTSTVTKLATEITATFTSFTTTTTTTSTSITYVYTCGSPVSSSPGIPPSNVASSTPVIVSSWVPSGTAPSGTAPSGTGPSSRPSFSFSRGPYSNSSSSASFVPYGTGTGVYHPPVYSTPLIKRQTQSFTTPPCVRHFKNEFGRNGLSSACACFALPTPSPMVTTLTIVDPSHTITSQRLVEVADTTTVAPTQTKTELTTTVKPVKTTTTITTSMASTVFGTFTRTIVSVSTSFTSLPTPSSFNIYYVDSAANQSSPANNFFHAVTAPGGNGIMLAPEATADNFGLDDQNRLMDLTDGGFLTKNTADLYPFEFLQTGATTLNTPICEACNGFLTCNYPGTIGNTFALCYGFLALGPPTVFGKDADNDGMVDCVAIALQYK